mmetsp:Transcript_12/g.29  ORF Transcript_12/g.29 Transcript_12/m.29 type:complete len:391 (-) Transcript_12:396-1568(-)|eukprot:CAMPEP_0198207442 /NCGR_PEP_ID=MMETSP1445-20131203/10890_1 /TAXON_ID=36898 /ORGANISM="Pyramimonas sp., Strain CCMP2087" /LENGTH=390 /DNA_ID=CAMNT_0043880469 /DNA_START=193 /DNA_END=1365 /DNA_ORIENTATION=-
MGRASTPANDPRYDGRWKMPGYTGHICGVSETIASTPVTAQRKAFFRTGTELNPSAIDPVSQPWRDACNNAAIHKKHNPDVLWPNICEATKPYVGKDRNSSLCLGDPRFEMKVTHYKDTHVHPQLQSSLWMPTKKTRDHGFDLVSMTLPERKALYHKMLIRVGETKLLHIEDNLRLRFAAKLNTAGNNNGFRLLKLFQNYDVNKVGALEIHEFRQAMHSFGLQLPEEAEIAMYAKFDVDENGTLDYKEFVGHFVEGEYLDLGFSAVTSQKDRQHAAADRASRTHELMGQKLKERFLQITSQTTTQLFMDIFLRLDEEGTGKVNQETFSKGMELLNLAFSECELDYIFSSYDKDESGINYSHFANDFCTKFTDTTLGQSTKSRPVTRHFQE